jgi:hypothetical protein
MGEWMCKSTYFLTSALVGGEWSDSRPGRITLGERAPGTHWIGGWLDPRAGLDDVEKRKFLTLPGLNSDPSVVQPIANRHTDCAIPAPVRRLQEMKSDGPWRKYSCLT